MHITSIILMFDYTVIALIHSWQYCNKSILCVSALNHCAETLNYTPWQYHSFWPIENTDKQGIESIQLHASWRLMMDLQIKN